MAGAPGQRDCRRVGGARPPGRQEGDRLFLAEGFFRFFVRDVTVTFHGLCVDGERVVVEETMTATPANGRHYANDCCFIFGLREGLIHRVRASMDTARGHRMVFGEVRAAG
ncbi:nuclear transport factor 2 family protein [Streptomyces sp. NPDC086554]|uniref:nuclear transport factor 2 family protein n=1 Tax=Streptomyces sp. NPDC086554 TaxID=3154864 RepID=UPI003443F82C